jgi:UDP-glucose:(glucosyl)LPS alpha-1,3-glucosyltransferase/UDP-D-galactose:(glucosyl)LPS alpha-1,3-D-galactosyltransferase/UDP-glucose:(galactosyl)LPS alpha-1,2-glucosyltransferase
VTLHVSCAADDAYAPHVAATVHSVCAHSGSLSVHVHLLADERLGEERRAELRALSERLGARIDFLNAPDEINALPSDERFTSAIWHRIFLPQLLPDLDRVLYLDADVIACRDLGALWKTPLEGFWLGAVTNVFQPNHRARPKQLGLPNREVYFNSGVLLMNLAEMRRDEKTEELLELVATRGAEFEWPDQDALNIALGQRRLGLHPRWNATNALRHDWSKGTFPRMARWRALLRPCLRHFEGPDANKPWDPDCVENQREVYWQHRDAVGLR